MSLASLEHLTLEFPEDTEAIRRLKAFFEKSNVASPSIKTISASRIYEVSRPSSVSTWARILQRLVADGTLKQIYRVESESFGGIGDFDSLDDIPPVMHDWRKDVDVVVGPEDVRLYFQVKTPLSQ